MDNKNFQNEFQFETNGGKAKKVWKTIGIIALAFVLAALTVVVINL